VTILQVQDLRKTFVQGFFRKKTEALRGISFDVGAGEIFGCLGPNGAGKTTTIKILMGLIFATSGSATLFGMPAGMREAKLRVGYLPERPYFYDYLSARELLDMVGRLYGLDGPTRRKRAETLLEQVGIADAAHRPLRSYSKGMVQRAGLAQALIGHPELVVLDEPMSGLDPIGRKQVRDIVLEQKKLGRTVFFSTHILSDASMMCDRVGIIVKGQLRDVGPLGELLSPDVHDVTVVWAGSADLVATLREFPGHHEETSEGHVYRADDEAQANGFVRKVAETGGSVLQVTPHRQSLEELFVSEAREEEQA
jgi:ABC-2 type transport system ATP-binding protein